MNSGPHATTPVGPRQTGEPAVRGLIFDMDGVLCDSEELMAEASCRMFEETHGVKPRTADFHEFMGRGSIDYFGGVGRKHGVTAILPRDRDRTYEIFRGIIRGRLKPLPGAVELIRAARRSGLKTAVATSADLIKLEAILDAIGLEPAAFDAFATADDVRHNKPAPDVFHAAMARVGLPPAQCVVVEDTPPGIAAALASGARCLALTTTFPQEKIAPLGARWLAPDLAHLPPDFLAACGIAPAPVGANPR